MFFQGKPQPFIEIHGRVHHEVSPSRYLPPLGDFATNPNPQIPIFFTIGLPFGGCLVDWGGVLHISQHAC